MNGAIEVKDENGVVVRRHSPFAPKKLAAFRRKLAKKLDKPDLTYKEAVIYAIEETPTYAAAGDMIGVSRATFGRWVKAWGITVER